MSPQVVLRRGSLTVKLSLWFFGLLRQNVYMMVVREGPGALVPAAPVCWLAALHVFGSVLMCTDTSLLLIIDEAAMTARWAKNVNYW